MGRGRRETALCTALKPFLILLFGLVCVILRRFTFTRCSPYFLRIYAMTPQNGAPKDTLYEQVLDFARREIEDASSQMDGLRQLLRPVEARVEAAKSVYEAVATRLNLEDELEEEAQVSNMPSMVPPPVEPPRAEPKVSSPPSVPEPSAPAPPAPTPLISTPVPSEPVSRPTPPSQPESVPPLAPHAAPHAAPQASPEPISAASDPAPPAVPPPASPPSAEPGNNGASDGFSMDLIRKHLEERDKTAQNAAQAPPRRPEAPKSAPSAAFVPPPAPAEPAPSASPVPPPVPPEPAPIASMPAPEPPKSPEVKPASGDSEQSSSGGFPGLSEADRALIGKYLRSKRDG
jgi:hypothetical protein